MLWVEAFEDKNNPEAAKIKADVCDRITKAVTSLENITQNEVNCTMVYLRGYPNQALLNISFTEIPQTVNGSEWAKQISELFDNVTEKTKDQKGPVAGKVQLQTFPFSVSVFENGHFSGWPNAYDSNWVVETIRNTLCFEITNLAQEDKLMRKFPMQCVLLRPNHDQSSACFRAQFQSENALDQEKVIEEFERTNANEGATYDIIASQYRFAPSLDKENSQNIDRQDADNSVQLPKKEHGTSTSNQEDKYVSMQMVLNMQQKGAQLAQSYKVFYFSAMFITNKLLTPLAFLLASFREIHRFPPRKLIWVTWSLQECVTTEYRVYKKSKDFETGWLVRRCIWQLRMELTGDSV
ncbi:unnamed protein product [Dicrocoelium dendriticum]|nr:unnamed protein product [Dicrocoelium dendriticum]